MKKNNTGFQALKYAAAVFIIVMFLWWFQGGSIISSIAPKPAPSEIIVVGTANALRAAAANVLRIVTGIFR